LAIGYTNTVDMKQESWAVAWPRDAPYSVWVPWKFLGVRRLLFPTF